MLKHLMNVMRARDNAEIARALRCVSFSRLYPRDEEDAPPLENAERRPVSWRRFQGNVDGIGAHAVNTGRAKLFSFAARNTFLAVIPARDHARFYEIKGAGMFRCPVSSGLGKNTGRPECRIGDKSKAGRNPHCP